jgi:DNA-binding response OmpR family regulator
MGRMSAAIPAPLRALVVDDEPALAELVADYLSRDGFEVECARDGEEALRRARVLDPDVVVLDLGLPGIDGLEVCRKLRTFSDCYVVMLTARADEVDTLVGLAVGADDYVTKPFSPRELVARVRVLLRRPRVASPESTVANAEVLRIGDLAINLDAREVSLAGEPVHLTRTELDLLAALAVRPTRVMTRSALLEDVWGGGWVGAEHLVDVHVLHVRQKLGDSAERQKYVRTVRGVGYRIGTGE